MIIAYTGLAGSGKTYHMTRTALDLIKRDQIVFSRHELEGAYPIVDEREMLRMSDCHVFYDEWHQDHSAKDWWDMDEVLKHIITQSRKYGIIIHWSAQHWLYMDAFVRRNTDYVWEHEALFRNPETGESRLHLHRTEKFTGLEVELKHRHPARLARKYFFATPKVFNNYSSYKPIMLSKEKLSDEDILKIQDPYSREKTHLQSSANHPENRHPYFVKNEDQLDTQNEANDGGQGAQREDESD